MKYRALVSFSGIISMAKGEEKEISDKELISDLLKAKYIEEVKENKNEDVASNEEVKETTKTNSKKK